MERKIQHCMIRKGRYMNIISVIYEDGSVDDGIGSYYPDEVHYCEDEFVGLTRKQASDLMTQRDREYLLS